MTDLHVVCDCLFYGMLIKIPEYQAPQSPGTHRALQPRRKALPKDSDPLNDHGPAWRGAGQPKSTNQHWPGLGPRVTPGWEGCAGLPEWQHSPSLTLEPEVAPGTSPRPLHARDCARSAGDFQELGDFPTRRAATTVRNIHPARSCCLLAAARHG